MTGMLPVNWHLRGDVNSEDFTLAGSGTADLNSGGTDLQLRVEPGFPRGFDPALSHMICNFALAGYTAVPRVAVSMRDAVTETMFVRPRRQIIITDAAGEQVTHLEALTTLTLASDGVTVTNFMTGFSRLPAAVVRATGEEVLVPGASGTATGVARYTVELAGGMALDGMTVVPYQFDRDVQITPARRTVADQSCAWVAEDTVRLRAASTWEALTVAAAAAGA